MEMCDICGVKDGLKCMVFVDVDDKVSRICHLCEEHMVVLYEDALNVLLDDNEYKVNEMVKIAYDQMLSKIITDNKIEKFGTINEEDELDINIKTPYEIKKTVDELGINIKTPYEIKKIVNIGEE